MKNNILFLLFSMAVLTVFVQQESLQACERCVMAGIEFEKLQADQRTLIPLIAEHIATRDQIQDELHFFESRDVVIRYAEIRIDERMRGSGWIRENDHIQLNLFEDEAFEAHVQRTKVNVNGSFTITAVLSDGEGYMVLATTGSRSLGHIFIPGEQKFYKIISDPDTYQHYLIEMDEQDRDILESSPPLIPEEINEKDIQERERIKNQLKEDDLGPEDVANIGVMVVYTNQAEQWAQSSGGGIDNVIAIAMANAQLVLDNSQTLMLATLVHSERVSYQESGSSNDDLRRLTAAPHYNPFGSEYSGHMEEVHIWRNQHSADLTAIFSYADDTGGLVWLLVDRFGNPNLAFSMTRVQQAATGYTHIHEMGHNMGLHHHAEQTVQRGPTVWINWHENTWSAGWRWMGNSTERYVSVMSYAGGQFYADGQNATQVPYFSNPNVTYQGGMTGNPLFADNARTLLEIKHVIANYRPAAHSGIITLDASDVSTTTAVSGGDTRKAQGGGLLARERERRELPEQVAALEAEIVKLRAAWQASEARAQAAADALRMLAERRRAAESRRREADRAVERQVRDLDKLIQETAWQEKLLAEAAAERAELEQAQERLEQERAEAETALAEAEAQLAALERELAALDEDESQHVVADRRTQVALVEQELGNRRVLAETRQREVARLERQITAQEHRIRSLAGELDALAGELDALQAQYAAARAAADALAAQVPPQEEKLAALDAALTALEAQEQQAHRTLREAEQRLSQAEVDAHRRADQAQTLRREIEDSLGIVVADLPESLDGQHPLPLEAIVAPLPIVAELPEGLKQQIRDLRTQIRRLEPVNPGAKVEYDELAERHGFLREQMADLEAASANLRQVIAELDEMMDTMFRATFKAIAKEFTRMFDLLFNGGTAKLLPLSDDEAATAGVIAGVEIMARPPGKRTSSLGMLSGGERTLTAVALLFAVMRVSPTPFCILDEVDAMLDEANVSRFRAMLHDLARDTQFVVITHNRGTVEVADTIYGVSMGEDGVSQMLSLSLEDLPEVEG